MGSWGPGLYSNDTSGDVRDICNEVYPLVGIEKGTELILEEYSEIVNSDIIDNDYADFWYALADWQWKHGILSDDIKQKTIKLLEAHTGIEEWEESGTAADVKKRLAVMEKLLDQLKSPQPKIKIPKAKIPMPKHKPGDIIVFRTCGKDVEYSPWYVSSFGFADFYAEEVANKLPKKISSPYEVYEKYMAILCVDTVEEQHSRYVPEIKEEFSVYAFYDYISDKKPDLNDLKECGFLPMNVRYDEKNAWTYTFAVFCQSFSQKRCEPEQFMETISAPDESARFHSLLAQKEYDSEWLFAFELKEVFSEIFDEKVRLELAGFEIDNLLDPTAQNPALRTPEEIDAILKEESRQWEEKVNAFENSEAYQNANDEEKLLLLRAFLKAETAE